jgi:hypothetical protein
MCIGEVSFPVVSAVIPLPGGKEKLEDEPLRFGVAVVVVVKQKRKGKETQHSRNVL